jgi:AraC-like DNA-binding protein
MKVGMVLETDGFLNLLEANQLNLFNQKFQNSVQKTLHHYEATIIRIDDASCHAVFPDASTAVISAHKIHTDFKYVTPRIIRKKRNLRIALGTVRNKENFTSNFKEIIRLCEYTKFPLVITRKIEQSYRKENKHAVIDKDLIYVLSENEYRFLSNLLDYLENNWKNTKASRKGMGIATGYSSVQLNRKVNKLTGKTPYSFLKHFRLRKALQALHDKPQTIKQLAVNNGFKNPTHFTRSFQESFNILPSKYRQILG